MNNELHLIGLNYKTAPVEIREAFALSDAEKVDKSLNSMGLNVAEFLILSTCNRVEILAVGPKEETKDHVLNFWARTVQKEVMDLEPFVYHYTGDTAVQHLFSVASSLDSMVLGEPQILGQLKDAYRVSIERSSSKVILSRLLHKSFSVAKRVRTETAIASSAVSVSYAAIELAKRIFGDMKEVNAMLIGAGEMAELAATYLVNTGIQSITVSNRTTERAQELASLYKGKAVPFDALLSTLPEIDIVISSTASPTPILSAKDMKEIIRKRKNKPMFFIDIAVPRDIDPDVNAIDNIYLYDIDDLKEVVQENLATRKEEAQKAHAIVLEETKSFRIWLDSLAIQPTIISYIKKTEKVAAIELEKAIKQMNNLEDWQINALQMMVKSMLKKINHAPLDFLKHGMDKGKPSEQNLSLFRRIFNLDEEDCNE